MQTNHKKILFTVSWLLLAVLAVMYWKVTLLVALAVVGVLACSVLNPTPMPPYRRNMSEEEWDDYEYQRYDRINARRRRERLIEAQESKSKSDRFERIAKNKTDFYKTQTEEKTHEDQVPALQKRT